MVDSSSPDISDINIEFDAVRLTGRFVRRAPDADSIWDRLRAKAISDAMEATITDNVLELPWANVLSLVREFGSRSQQQQFGFRFRPVGAASEMLRKFSDEVRATNLFKATGVPFQGDITGRLSELGFTKRSLKPFQLRDLRQLLQLPHGANFSVPGAGKTTVTFALHLLVHRPNQKLVVIGPKSSFAAWREVVDQCMDPTISTNAIEQFCILEGSATDIDQLLRSGNQRYLISYDLAVRQADLLASYLARNPVHLVLDEAHRMKAGLASQRGAFLLNVASLPVRRDILTGTPMPQGPNDLAAQLGFLWPGQGLDLQISRGRVPREVCQHLYVRTTKNELGIPPAKRHFIQVPMAPGHLALYAVVRREALSQLAQVTSAKIGSQIDFVGARRSVMRLLQLSSNPILALQGMTRDIVGLDSGIADQVILEGPSLKMRAVEDHVRSLVSEGKKALVWTIFTDTLHELERMLADLNPVSLYGDVPTGNDSDLNSREGRIRRFHVDSSCHVLIANPAAAGEGISLHTVCHDAIYLDRSYVSTHYLQSIDRIHRLGLAAGTETNISIYQTKAPAGLGSIDFSVSRRLRSKIRGLQQLLDDPDLHEVALDEEAADDPIDYSVDLQDLVDLVAELEGTARNLDEDET
ncbi:DEAD/DEAH box helicase [Bradyrhizobium erythrophlei]|uniref:SNF2 family N-terminal domain-containing protein n=1 Tax=Bradyrhizobium erythrophlei TaxID=1437360 RepID=A0A1M5PYP2_9BRAD|nr:DEAD/DEAH box helicase [Bradyrhizobium erythrophlei]SHH07015.1 SNF2 family N-terminal domain-containing protein [Bradyrhizobium erythrophlei]